VPRLLLGLALLITPGAAQAQVLITGENGGSGAQSLMVSGNSLSPDGVSDLHNFWLQYGRGLASRLDAFALYGNITTEGQTQHYLSAGFNLGLLKHSTAFVDLSLYALGSVPFTRTEQACDVLFDFAVVVSRPLKLGGITITPYSGFNMLVPAGHPEDKLFTPPETVKMAIVGLSVPFAGKWNVYAEWDPGSTFHAFGLGVLRAIP
jgi:hypothetical protein